MDRLRQWHRWFGASWRDFVTGQPVTVEVEMDLSLRLQLLDVALIRREGEITIEMPDGFDDFGAHNLISFKSFQETLDEWSLEEFLSYFVDYRKQASPDMRNLLPLDLFRRYAVCARFPQGLAAAGWLRQREEGVYEVRHFTGLMRVVVLNRLPLRPRNAAMLRFSADPTRIAYATRTYESRSPDGTSLLAALFAGYRSEGFQMPYTVEDQRRDTQQFVLDHADPDELLKRLTPEKRLEGLSPEKRLEGLSPEKRLEGLSPEKRLEGLSPEKRLEGLSPEQLEILRRLLAETPPDEPKP